MRHFSHIELTGNEEHRPLHGGADCKPIDFRLFKDVLKKGSRILFINYTDTVLIEQINRFLDSQMTLICYDQDLAAVVNARKIIHEPNILFIHSDFKYNSLDFNSIDLVVGNKLLGNSHSRRDLTELNRLLKNNGKFIFLELISIRKAPEGFRSYFKSHEKHEFNRILFNFEKRMKYFNRIRMDLKIIGNGNYYFKANDINSLQEFLDNLGYEAEKRVEILSDIYLALITGERIQLSS